MTIADMEFGRAEPCLPLMREVAERSEVGGRDDYPSVTLIA